MTKDEALKMALEALEMNPLDTPADVYDTKYQATITAIKEALAQPEYQSTADKSQLEKIPAKGTLLAQPEQEPVAWANQVVGGRKWLSIHASKGASDRWLEYRLKEQAQGEQYKQVALYTTPPQRTGVGLDWLPEHKCGLHLSHNEHRDVYETIEQFYDSEDFISPEEWHEALAKDSVWVLHWYPETPIGFIRIAASTLDAIEAKLKEKNT
jgi:hypothetical protein